MIETLLLEGFQAILQSTGSPCINKSRAACELLDKLVNNNYNN